MARWLDFNGMVCNARSVWKSKAVFGEKDSQAISSFLLSPREEESMFEMLSAPSQMFTHVLYLLFLGRILHME